MRIVIKKRLRPLSWRRYFFTPLAILAAGTLGGVLFLWIGVNPLRAYREILVGAFGSFYSISEVLVRASPLILCGLAVGLPAKMRIWNIGAEGQLVMGGIAGAGTALFLSPFLADFLLVPAIIAAGMLGGAAWGFFPGILKARMNVNEIITSLMLNYVAIFWMEHLFFGPWRDPAGRGFPGTAMFPEAAWLPRYLGTRLHLGLPLSLIAAVFIWLLLSYSNWGYRVRVAGANPGAAVYARLNISSQVLWVMVIGGGLAGLAGVCETAGIHLRLQQGLAAGIGYLGIVVAWMGKLRPGAIVIISILLAGLMAGGDQVQITMQVPSAIGLVLQALLLFCVLCGQVFQEHEFRIERRSAAVRPPADRGTKESKRI